MILYYTVLYCTLLYSTLLYSTPLNHTIGNYDIFLDFYFVLSSSHFLNFKDCAGEGNRFISCTFSVRDIERLLCTYAGTLRQWNAILQATEVSKHMQPDAPHISVSKMKTNIVITTVPLDVKNDRNRDKDRDKNKDKDKVSTLQLEDVIDDKEEILDFVTLVACGINCPRCGVATEGSEVTEDTQISSNQEQCQDQYRTQGQGEGYSHIDKKKVEEKEKEKLKEESKKKKNAMWCDPCRDFAFTCSLCQMCVKGSGYFCASCGHGGHIEHMREWFQYSVECSSGCGCRCGELSVTRHDPMSVSRKNYNPQSPRGENNMDYWGVVSPSRGINIPSEGSRSDKDDRRNNGKEYFPFDSQISTDDTEESQDDRTVSESESESEPDIDIESEYNSDVDVDDADDRSQGWKRDKKYTNDFNDSYQSFNEDWDQEA